MRILPLAEKHVGACAALVTTRYAALRRTVTQLPSRYDAPEEFVPRLAAMIHAHPGVVALDADGVAGFLAGWRIPSMRGERGIYSPEWANGVSRDGALDPRRTWQELYAALAGQWVSEGYVEHFVTIFAHDTAASDTWFGLGFGSHGVDAVRSLDPVRGPLGDVLVRRASVADFPALVRLEAGLQAHLRSAPTFLPVDADDDHAEMRAFVEDEANAVFLAERDGEAVAYLRFQPASTDASTIIRDAGTTSITGAYTVEGARGGGIARALLSAGLAWARESGYTRCAVDFEAANTLAVGFWLRHFRPVALSLRRHINPAVI